MLHDNHSFMEFATDKLNAIIMNIFNEHSTQTNNNKEIKIEPTESSSDLTEQSTTIPTTTTITTTSSASSSSSSSSNNKRPYYFIVFNNPRWSQILRKNRQKV